jgi:two-component system cell cycle sensor histidine kinase/response regulator CckA
VGGSGTVDSARARAEAALRRDATLEAVAFAAQRFLEEQAWEEVVPEVLRRLCLATSTSRSYVFQNHRVTDGTLRSTQRWEWVADGIPPEIDNPSLQNLSWDGAGLSRWAKVLGSGAVIQGHVREFPPSERGILERQQILSLLEVPIFVSGRWWGIIGFDDCVQEREWSQVEIDALRAAAAVLGTAIRRQRDEEQVREAEARFRTIVERTPAVTYQQLATEHYDASSSVVYVSPQIERILGYPAESWWTIPGFWSTLVHPDDLQAILAESDRTSTSGEPFAMEYRMISADGRTVWFHDESVLIRDDAGDPLLRQGVMIDVTERHTAEEALREAQTRYQVLVEHVPVTIYREPAVWDPSEFYISPQSEDMFGYLPAEWQDKLGFWEDRIHEDDRQEVRAANEHANSTGEPFCMEYRFRAKDGRFVWVHDEATLVCDETGTPRFWQGFMLNITERKKAEEQLERALRIEREAGDRLRALDEMKNTFLQAVSHDLRTPLAAILGLAVTLERDDMDLDTPEAREMARRIATNAHKLDRMVADLLDLDRLARGIIEPKLHPTDVGALVQRMVAESDLISERRVHIEAQPITVSVDGAKVERIVENLLANTARHTPADTRVWIRVEPAQGGVLIAVEDEGPGVPEGLRDTIFEPFRQGPQVAPSPGVGVGLTLVARFAELLGGNAWVQEREGGGASFRVFLADGGGEAATEKGGQATGAQTDPG